MISAYVVDDEHLAVQRLTRLLQETRRVEVVGSTTDPEQALAFLRDRIVDVVFLDIEMPGLTGFEMLEQLDPQPKVVFTTAYDAHALKAFEVNSIDYLLKPIDPERLVRALDKLSRLSPSQAQSKSADIRALARQLVAELAPRRKLERIASRVGERTTILDVARVTHFFSRDKLTFAACGGRDHVVDYTLGELEAQLDPRRFARIHRGTIVNVSMIQELCPDMEGGVLVRLKDEQRTQLSVSRDRVRGLKQRLGI